jgi:beta-N-acetylhexosaminidase
MKDEFLRRGILCDMQRDIWIDTLKEKEADCDLVIFALSRLPHHHLGTLDMYEKNAASVWASHCGDPDKTIVVAFGSPYGYSMYYKKENIYINAYSPKVDTIKAFVKALFGEIPFMGVSPVKL